MTSRWVKDTPGRTSEDRFGVSPESRTEYNRLLQNPTPQDQRILQLLLMVAKQRAGIASKAELARIRAALEDKPEPQLSLVKSVTNATPTAEAADKLAQRIQEILDNLSAIAA